MADSSRMGGKSVSMLRKQKARIVEKMNARIEQARANGASQEELSRMQQNMNKVVARANVYIQNAKTQAGVTRTSPIENTWKQVDRSVYTRIPTNAREMNRNGQQMGRTRAGQVGQFRAGNGNRNRYDTTEGGNTRGTTTRRYNQLRHGIQTTYRANNASGAERTALRNSMARQWGRNASMRYGIRQATKTLNRTNKKGVNKRTTSNTKNYDNARLGTLIRFQRRQGRAMPRY